MKKLCILAMVALSATIILLCVRLGENIRNDGKGASVKRDTVVRYDTVVYRQPMAKEIRPAGERNVRVGRETVMRIVDTMYVTGRDSIRDSVEISLPAEQRVYKEKEYMVYVSGVGVRMDSIMVYPRKETVTLTVTKPQKRWHIGIVGGAGSGRNGLSPYIGVGIMYSLFSF